MYTLINGKSLAASIKSDLAEKTQKLSEQYGRRPCLAVILVGENQASVTYVKNKEKACEVCGITSEKYNLPDTTSEEEVLSLIDRLNADDTVDGILCQLPLPSHINEKKIINAISPEKDVDGFSPVSVGRLVTGDDGFVSCTPAGILELLKSVDTPISGKHCVVIGRSNIVGKPV